MSASSPLAGPTTTHQVIPRTIHWLWLGDAPIPELFTCYLESWRTHHPDWDTRLWRDADLPRMSVQAEYTATKSFKTRYDMVRLELLRQFGGVIVDMDVEAIRPIDPLLPGVTAFAGEIAGGHVGNQVLGAVPHHPFFEEAVERLRRNCAMQASSSETTGKAFLRRLVNDLRDSITLFPPETFHFEPAFAPPKRPHEFPRVYAVHHQLESYAVVAPPETLDVAVSILVDAAATLQAALPSNIDEARAQFLRAERRLRRAIRMQEHGHRARAQQLIAGREQVEVRLARAERRARELAFQLERDLAAASDSPAQEQAFSARLRRIANRLQRR